MAESMIEPLPNSNIYNEELVRDSLESSIEECDNSSISTIRTNDTESHETAEGYSCVSLPNDLAKVSSTIDKEQKPMTDTKKHAIRPKAKNMIELNKINIKKGQTKSSYSKMHQKTLSRKAPIEKKGQNEVSQYETSGPSIAAIECHKQLVLDGILTEKDELNNFSSYENMMHFHNYGTQETNQFGGLLTFGKDEYKLESTISNETNISQVGKQYFVGESSMSGNVFPKGMYPNGGLYKYMERSTNGAFRSPEDGAVSHEHQLPPVCNFPTSVQSAPADMQAYQDPLYEKSFRTNSLIALKPGESYTDLNNSMMSLASTKSASEQVASLTYSGIYANAKQDSRTNYKPYTLSDYKILKKQSKPGGLGPDTKSEEHQQKTKIAIRQKEYSVAVKQMNTSENYHGKKKRMSTTKQLSVQKQEANARRVKALEYAKAIPKPVTSKNQNVWKSPSKAVEEPQTLLAILQRRHENEKKAIDAMRKDLQTKLKTR